MESATRHKSACLHRSCAQSMPGYDLQLLAAFMTINSKDCQFQGSPSGFYVERMSTNAAKLLHSLPCGSCPRGHFLILRAMQSGTLAFLLRTLNSFTPCNELRTPCNTMNCPCNVIAMNSLTQYLPKLCQLRQIDRPNVFHAPCQPQSADRSFVKHPLTELLS